MEDLKQKRKQFIKDKVFYCLSENDLNKELTERNLNKSDVILIDDTMGVIKKEDKKEFLELFKDDSIKNKINLYEM